MKTKSSIKNIKTVIFGTVCLVVVILGIFIYFRKDTDAKQDPKVEAVMKSNKKLKLESQNLEIKHNKLQEELDKAMKESEEKSRKNCDYSFTRRRLEYEFYQIIISMNNKKLEDIGERVAENIKVEQNKLIDVNSKKELIVDKNIHYIFKDAVIDGVNLDRCILTYELGAYEKGEMKSQGQVVLEFKSQMKHHDNVLESIGARIDIPWKLDKIQ